MEIYILGNGSMAEAMAIGLSSKFKVIIVSREKQDSRYLSEFNIKNELYGQKYDIEGKNIILAFKPYALKEVSKKLVGKAEICISVLAMTKLEDLKHIDSKVRVCAMPNIAAKFKASTTIYYTNDDDSKAAQILKEFGDIYRVYSDDEFKISGVVSGCVPAYLALINEALQNGCVREGINKELARSLVNSSFKSSVELMQNFHPAIMKEKVCSPKGMTIEGVYFLEKNGIRGIFMEALNRSINKK
ncbi:pyrroline-5-carboxylate reductase [Campylobacter blaseri]|nr:pyrroline-5-carboxylate reductase [Campylobacter blaseri]